MAPRNMVGELVAGRPNARQVATREHLSHQEASRLMEANSRSQDDGVAANAAAASSQEPYMPAADGADMRWRLGGETPAAARAVTWPAASQGDAGREPEAIGWSRGLEDLLKGKDEQHVACARAGARSASAGGDAPPAAQHLAVAGGGGAGGGAVAAAPRSRLRGGSDAAEQEVTRLVAAQDARVSEVEARLKGALEDAELWRSRASQAESRASAVETRLAAVLQARTTCSQQPQANRAPAHPQHDASSVQMDSEYAARRQAGQGMAEQGDKIETAETSARERRLLDMLQESHALLISETKQLRADLDAEREARRNEAAQFQRNWSQFESLRRLVEAAPAFEGPPGTGTDGCGAAAVAPCSYSVGCLPLSASPLSTVELPPAPPPAPQLLRGVLRGVGTGQRALSTDEDGREISGMFARLPGSEPPMCACFHSMFTCQADTTNPISSQQAAAATATAHASS